MKGSINLRPRVEITARGRSGRLEESAPAGQGNFQQKLMPTNREPDSPGLVSTRAVMASED